MQTSLVEVSEISVDSIADPKLMLRSEVSRSELDDLVQSIRNVGLLEPILVRKAKQSYELVAGYRRVRAFRRLGIPKIPCVVVSATDQQALELSLIENVQHQTLNPVDEAIAFKRYIEDFGYGGFSTLASKIGKSQSYVSLRMALLRLPKEVLEQIISRQISASNAQELLPLSTSQQRRIAAMITDKKLTKREVRSLVKNATREEFEGVEWLSVTRSPNEISTAEEKAVGRTISLLKSSLANLSDILDSLPEASILREALFEYRLSINAEIDSLIKLGKKISTSGHRY